MKKHPLIVCFMLAILALATQGSAQQKIAVSYPGIAGYNIPFWVTMDTAEFKKAGLEVDPVLISGGSKSMQALLSGGLDFAHVSGGVSVQASLSGADVVIIGTGSNSRLVTLATPSSPRYRSATAEADRRSAETRPRRPRLSP